VGIHSLLNQSYPMKKTHLLCFIGGDFLSTLFTLLFGGEVTHFFLKAVGTVIIGVIGGVAGLAGKDIYPLLKASLIRLIYKLYKNKK
jgi:hypothetical protein